MAINLPKYVNMDKYMAAAQLILFLSKLKVIDNELACLLYLSDRAVSIPSFKK